MKKSYTKKLSSIFIWSVVLPSEFVTKTTHHLRSNEKIQTYNQSVKNKIAMVKQWVEKEKKPVNKFSELKKKAKKEFFLQKEKLAKKVMKLKTIKSQLSAKSVKPEMKAPPLDRRISLRIPVPLGSMMVHWTTKLKEKKHAPAINISMNGILIDTSELIENSIDYIKCLLPDKKFYILDSRIVRHTNDGKAVIELLKFENDVNTRMKWVEILTRIEKGEQA